MSKFGTREKCEVCQKTVYPDDKIVVDNKILHGTCFRCKKCNTKLSLGNYAALEGVPYCKTHFKEAFKLKGRYDFAGGEGAKSGSAQESSPQETPAPAPVVQQTTPPPQVGGPPPPPPSGPPPPPPVVESVSDDNAPSHADLFASINQLRDNAGAGLRKVKNEEKTKYRKEEEKVSVVPDELPKKGAVVAGKANKKQGPPKFELAQGMGEKWIVENQEGQTLEITETKTKQGVYIYNCRNTYVTIKGKVNNVILDKCAKSGVILDDAVSSVEMVNCNGVKVQILGSVPTINVDKTDGVQIFLSQTSIEASIITSKSSEMNVLVPGETEDDDMIEIPIPEQFQHQWNAEQKKVITEVVTINM